MIKTTTTKTKYCDFCKKDMTEEHYGYFIHLTYSIDAIDRSGSGGWNDSKGDVCSDCSQKIKNLFDELAHC